MSGTQARQPHSQKVHGSPVHMTPLRHSSIKLEFSKDRPETFENISPDSKFIVGGGAANAEVNFRKLMKVVKTGEEVECDIDEEVDNENFQERNINNSFINKLKDFSSFNPSGNKGREKGTLSMIVIPRSVSRAAGGDASPTDMRMATLLSLRKGEGTNGKQVQPSPDTIFKLNKFDETQLVGRSDEDKTPIKRPLTLPTQGEIMEAIFAHNPASRPERTPRDKEYTLHYKQQLVPFAQNDIGQNSTPRSITSTPATKQQLMTDNNMPMGTIEDETQSPRGQTEQQEVKLPHQIGSEIHKPLETPCVTEHHPESQPHNIESVNGFLDTPSRRVLVGPSSESHIHYKNNSSTASSHPNLVTGKIGITKASLPDIGTDPRIQLQFFTQLLHEKERELLQQRHRYAQLRATCRMTAARQRRLAVLLRDARADNLALQEKANELVACKLMRP